MTTQPSSQHPEAEPAEDWGKSAKRSLARRIGKGAAIVVVDLVVMLVLLSLIVPATPPTS